MLQAEPLHILDDRGDMLRPAAGAVDVLDAQKEFPSKGTGKIVRAHCGKGMADMQPAIGAGCKAGGHDLLRRKWDACYFTHRITIYGVHCPLDVNLCRHNLPYVKML
jgi:hypothetical protein